MITLAPGCRLRAVAADRAERLDSYGPEKAGKTLGARREAEGDSDRCKHEFSNSSPRFLYS